MESQGDLTTHVAAVTAARMAAAPQQAEQGESLDKAEKKRSRIVEWYMQIIGSLQSPTVFQVRCSWINPAPETQTHMLHSNCTA